MERTNSTGHRFTQQELRRQEALRQRRGLRPLRNYALRRQARFLNRLVAAELDRPDTLLDLGCGVGTLFMEDRPPCGRLVGVDLSPSALRLARRHGATADLLAVADAARLPFPDALFEAVVARGVLHHLGDLPGALLEVRRVLRPGGAFVILEGRSGSWYRQVFTSLAELLRRSPEPEHHAYPHIAEGQLRRLLETLGFRIARWQVVPGLAAPLAYAGLGGAATWRVVERVEELLARLNPTGFSWWYLCLALRRGGPDPPSPSLEGRSRP